MDENDYNLLGAQINVAFLQRVYPGRAPQNNQFQMPDNDYKKLRDNILLCLKDDQKITVKCCTDKRDETRPEFNIPYSIIKSVSDHKDRLTIIQDKQSHRIIGFHLPVSERGYLYYFRLTNPHPK